MVLVPVGPFRLHHALILILPDREVDHVSQASNTHMVIMRASRAQHTRSTPSKKKILRRKKKRLANCEASCRCHSRGAESIDENTNYDFADSALMRAFSRERRRAAVLR